VGEKMEKLQLVNFIAKVMEESGFKVYKDFKTSQMIIDIYGVLPTLMGDFGVVVACKNYDKEWEVGIDILKEMEMIGRSLKASQVAIVTSSTYSSQAKAYGSRKNIKLIDRENLIVLAQKFLKNGTSLSNKRKWLEKHEILSNNENFQENKDNPPVSNEDNIYNGYDSVNHKKYGGQLSSDNYNNKVYLSRNSNLRTSNIEKKEVDNIRPDSNILNKQPPKPKKNKISWGKIATALLNNTIVLIILVVGISFLFSYGLERAGTISNTVSGIFKMISALLLSYGFVLGFNRNWSAILLKGTIVFFVSLVVLILIIIFF
jgi:hypothetical protein